MNHIRIFIATHRSRIVFVARISAILFWMAIWIKAFFWFQATGMEWKLRSFPHALRRIMTHAGMWGPLLMIGLQAARTFFLVPSSVLEVAAGSVYGPLGGTIINIIGANISAALAFSTSRFIGRSFFSRTSRGRLKRYDEAISRDAFFTIFLMRIILVPFDIVNYASGMTGIAYSEYALATFLGTLPAVIAFTIAGDSLGKPQGVIICTFLTGIIVLLMYFLKRSIWVRRKLRLTE